MQRSSLTYMCTKLADLLLKLHDRDRTRTCNPQIRSLVPYPLGHTTSLNVWIDIFFRTLRAEGGIFLGMLRITLAYSVFFFH